MRNLATIQVIKSLSPIPNADTIEKAEILGWEIVVKKNDFNVGDKVIFCEIDAILPELPCFEFMRSKKYRVRTVKLRGQVSQGIAFPLSTVKEVDPTINIDKLRVGDDMTQIMQITKYDPESALDIDGTEPQEKKSWIANKWSYVKWKLFGFRKVKSHGDFPDYCPKTDETRVQNMGRALMEHEGQPIYITSKVEGTSATFIYRRNGNALARLFGQGYHFLVCSRNRIIYNSQKDGKTEHHILKVAERYNILEEMKKLNRNIAIQGEVIGPKIQKNVYKLTELDFKVFLIYDIDAQKYLPFQETIDLVNKMGLSFVPIVDINVPIVNNIKYYVDLSKGYSKINPKTLREGIVARTMDGSFSFKSINPDYLLSEKN